jgi:epoxyqueuosine reductase
MKERIRDAFLHSGIEYFAARDYGELRVINPALEGRLGFVPKSAFIFLIPYFVSEGENLSTYATSLDYHAVIRMLGADVISSLTELFPTAHFFACADHAPIDERHAALTSALGVVGKNGLIINERYGSYVFIGEILTDLPPCSVFASSPTKIEGCEGCGACLDACPTGILAGKGCECLSELTQRKGELAAKTVCLMKKVGTVWGCDECQRSCPYNSDPAVTPIEYFHRERLTRVSLSDINAMTDEQFARRAYAWRGRKVITRNLAAVEGED